MNKYDKIKKILSDFRKARNWEQFHDPKNLAEAISIEAGELLEIFLWKSINESKMLTDNEKKRVREEVSDIFIFLLYLCDIEGIDIFNEAFKKIEENEKKYPIAKVKGKSTKYKEL